MAGATDDKLDAATRTNWPARTDGTMKLLAVFLVTLSAQAALVTISDTIYDSHGALINCTVYATPNRDFISSAGHVTRPNTITISVRSGILSTTLEANIGATPAGTYYNVSNNCGTSLKRIWTIPASGPVGIAAIESGAPSTSISVGVALTTSASLNFPAILDGNYSDLTISVPGAVAGHSIAPGWPATLGSGLIGSMWVSAVDTVTVRLLCMAGSTCDPPALTYSVVIY